VIFIVINSISIGASALKVYQTKTDIINKRNKLKNN